MKQKTLIEIPPYYIDTLGNNTDDTTDQCVHCMILPFQWDSSVFYMMIYVPNNDRFFGAGDKAKTQFWVSCQIDCSGLWNVFLRVDKKTFQKFKLKKKKKSK
jgi:hypothetical protein